MSLDALRDLAVDAAHAAGVIQLEGLRTARQVDYKSAEIDLVTQIDRACEERIAAMIAARFPDHQLLAEEGTTAGQTSEYRWIVDPVDGTTNYAHGYPIFCVSIAVERAGEVVAGVVHAPTLRETFVATRGGGAFLNGEPIRVSRTDDLNRSLLATGFPYDIRTRRDNNLDHWNTFAVRCRAVRRDGAAALNLAYVAAGRFDGFWETVLQTWDMAAGALLIREAGGRLSDLWGRPFDLFGANCVASNGLIHDQILQTLRLNLPPAPATA
jgi:myo-inositol-1(or 4)-monophosphatase